MSEPSTDLKETSNSASGLWWVCVGVIAVVLTAWSATRWKPVGWFPAGYGAALGLIGTLLANWVHISPQRARTIGLVVLTAIGASSSLMMAAQLQKPYDNSKLTGLAAEMVKTHERLTGSSDSSGGSSPWQLWAAGLRGYLQSRYGRYSDSALAAGMILEAAVAACASWGASRLVRTAPPGLEREAPA